MKGTVAVIAKADWVRGKGQLIKKMRATPDNEQATLIMEQQRVKRAVGQYCYLQRFCFPGPRRVEVGAHIPTRGSGGPIFGSPFGQNFFRPTHTLQGVGGRA